MIAKTDTSVRSGKLLQNMISDVIICPNKSPTAVGLQIYKMINLGTNVIVYKLKHCVLHFEVKMMTF